MFHRIDADRAGDADIALLTALAIMARCARAVQKQKIFISDKVPAIRRYPRTFHGCSYFGKSPHRSQFRS